MSRKIKRKNSSIVMILLIVVCLLAACNAKKGTIENSKGEQPEETKQAEGIEKLTEYGNKVIKVRIPAPSLENNIIEEETEQPIAVYLPKDYETSDKEYPVLYFLPGYRDSYVSYMDMFSKSMDELLLENKVKDMIVVTINGENRFHGSFYANSPVTGNWEDFVTHDVVGYVDENFRTIKNSNARGLAGHSMGGFGVINIAMHTSGLFDYAYSMSPGIFAEEGMEQSALSFNAIKECIEDYKELNKDEAREKYLYESAGFSWPKDFSFAYGSAFASDPEGEAPYIKLPKQNKEGDFLKDDVWKLYEKGYGNVKEKIETYKDNLPKLKGFIIEYGTDDEYQWIPEGCEYFSDLLDEKKISHKLVTYEGYHQNLVGERIHDEVLSFFSEAFYGE